MALAAALLAGLLTAARSALPVRASVDPVFLAAGDVGDGRVYGFGAAKPMGDAAPAAGAETVDLEPTPSGNGY